MRTVALPDGSVVPVVDLKSVHVHKHFHVLRKSDDYYVRIIMRDGATRDVAEHLSADAAQARRDELISLMQYTWDEIEPYEHGYQEGRQQGRSEGYSDGFVAGNSEGYRCGQTDGLAEGRHSIISYLVERREQLMREQATGDVYPPNRRRYIRNGVDLLTNIIHYFCPEPSDGSAHR